MSDPQVLVAGEPKKPARPRVEVGPGDGWKWVGWFGALFAVTGLGDLIIAWVPLRLGNPEWEFGTVAASMSGLAIVTIGLAALVASGVARGVRWLTLTAGWALMVLGVFVMAAYVLFLLDVPMALQAVQGDAAFGIHKVIAKTTLLAVAFGAAYLSVGSSLLRSIYGASRGAGT